MTREPRRRWMIITACCLGLLAGDGAPRAAAQGVADDGTLERQYYNCAKVFATPEARDLLLKIDMAIKAERWIEVIERTVQLNEQHRSEVIKIAPGRFIGVRDAVLERMRSLPEPARKAFRVSFDSRLEKELAAAIAQRDVLALHRIGYDMFLSTHSAAALETLLELEMERGNLEAAAAAGAELAARAGTNPVSATLGARLGQLYAELGDSKKLDDWRDRCRPQAGDSLQIGGAPTTLGEFLDALTVKPAAAAPVESATSWKKFGGTPDNNAVIDATLSLSTRKWDRPVPDQTRINARPAMIQRSPGGNYWEDPDFEPGMDNALAMPLFPVIANNLMYVHGNDQVFCYNLFTNQLKWSWKTAGTSKYLYEDENTIFTSLIYRNLLIVSLEAPYTQELDMYSSNYFVKPYVPDRFLIAFDRHTGAVVWRQDRNTANPRLQRCSYPLTPVVFDDKLYTVCTVEIGEQVTQSVVCLDPDTGDCLWQLELCNGLAESNMFGRNLRESVPTPPVIVNGKFIFGTNYGAVIAVDLPTRDVEWVTYYPVSAIPRAQGLELLWREQGWCQNPVIHAGGMLYLAPTDCRGLLALRAADGAVVWQFPRRVNDKYLLGVTPEGHVIVQGGTIAALDAATGTLSPAGWETATVFLSPAGRGVLTPEGIYAPSEDGLYLFDAGDGRLLKKQAWNNAKEAGNLLLLSGDIAVTTGMSRSNGPHVTVFYDFARLEKNYLAQIENQTADPLAFFELGSIYQQARKSDDAVRYLEKAAALAARQPEAYAQLLTEANAALYMAYLEQGDSFADMPQAIAAYQKAENVAINPEQRIAVALKIEAACAKAGDLDRRAAIFEDMAKRFSGVAYGFPEGGEMPAGLYAYWRLAELHHTAGKDEQAVDAWQDIIRQYRAAAILGKPAGQVAADAIAALLKARGASLYRGQEDAAGAWLRADTVESLAQVVLEYPNFREQPAAVLRLGKKMLAEKRAADLIRVMREYCQAFPASDGAPYAMLNLALAYEDRGHYSNARGVLLRLQRDFHDRELLLEGKSARTDAFVGQKLQDPAYRQLAAGGLWTVPLPLQDKPVALPLAPGALILQPHGAAFGLEQAVCVTERGGLQIYDPVAGKALHTLKLGNPLEQADELFVESEWLVVVCDSSIDTFNIEPLTRDPAACTTAWRREFEGQIKNVDVKNGIALVDVMMRQQHLFSKLMAIDVHNGEVLWEKELMKRTDGPLQIASLCGIAIIEDTVTFFDLLSGAVLHEETQGPSTWSAPILLDERLVAFTTTVRKGRENISTLSVFDAIASTPLWKTNLPAPVSGLQVLAGDANTVVVSLLRGRRLAAYETLTGALRWECAEFNPGSPRETARQLWMEDGGFFAIAKREAVENNDNVTYILLVDIDRDTGKRRKEHVIRRVEQNTLDVSYCARAANCLAVNTASYEWKTESTTYTLSLLQRESGDVAHHLPAALAREHGSLVLSPAGVALAVKNGISLYGKKQE